MVTKQCSQSWCTVMQHAQKCSNWLEDSLTPTGRLEAEDMSRGTHKMPKRPNDDHDQLAIMITPAALLNPFPSTPLLSSMASHDACFHICLSRTASRGKGWIFLTVLSTDVALSMNALEKANLDLCKRELSTLEGGSRGKGGRGWGVLHVGETPSKLFYLLICLYCHCNPWRKCPSLWCLCHFRELAVDGLCIRGKLSQLCHGSEAAFQCPPRCVESHSGTVPCLLFPTEMLVQQGMKLSRPRPRLEVVSLHVPDPP